MHIKKSSISEIGITNLLPFSELKRRMWDKIGRSSQDENIPTQPEFNNEGEVVEDMESCENPSSAENVFISDKLKQLEDLVSTSGGSRRCSRNFQSVPVQVADTELKDSQAFTVDWVYKENEEKETFKPVRIFMISGVEGDLRETLAYRLEQLGATVSKLSNYDPTCTHLICPKPARNEKTLSCMAAGKWILHISYVEESVAAEEFLNEEEFEFGNPNARRNIMMQFDKENEIRMQSMHWWRKEITRRGYGAFNDMRAIVVANKREPIVRVIEAGGGIVVNVRPPFDDSVHVTHCLLEPKSVTNFSDYIPLATQGIFCVNTLYISEFLYRTNEDIRDSILPFYAKYY